MIHLQYKCDIYIWGSANIVEGEEKSKEKENYNSYFKMVSSLHGREVMKSSQYDYLYN